MVITQSCISLVVCVCMPEEEAVKEGNAPTKKPSKECTSSMGTSAFLRKGATAFYQALHRGSLFFTVLSLSNCKLMTPR